MEQKQQPLLTPIMRWFMLAIVLANIAGSMYTMFMPIYLTDLGASIGQVGLVFTVSAVVMLFLQILGGWISDSIGRLRAIAIGSIGGVLAFLAMLLAPTWPWMLAAIAFSNIPYAIVGPSFGAFIAENSAKENRGRVYGITGTIFQITGIVGPPLGGFLFGSFGFKRMLLVASIFYFFAAAIRIWMARSMIAPEKTKPEPLTFSSLSSSIKTMMGFIVGGGVITWIFITDGVRDIASSLTSDIQPIYLDQVANLSIQEIGILGAIFSIAMMITPILSGKISDEHGERVPITGGFLLIFAAYVMFLNANTFLVFALTWVVFGLGVGMLSPAYQSLISKVVPQKMLGTFTGLFQSSRGLISLPAPVLGAKLWEWFNPKLPFIITAGASLITIIPTWLFFRVPEEKTEPSSTDTEISNS